MKKLNRKQVEALCYHINNKYETAHGNCGMFAYALASVLGFDKCSIVIAQNDYYHEDGFYHVAVKYGGRLWDGHGQILSENLKAWADDEGLWGDGINSKSYLEHYRLDDQTAWDSIDDFTLQKHTDWMLPYQVFYLEMLNFLGRDIPESLKETVSKMQCKCGTDDGLHGNLNENQICQVCGFENRLTA